MSLSQISKVLKKACFLVRTNARYFVAVGFLCEFSGKAGVCLGFCGIKILGVFLLPPGWDASPPQGYPPALSSPVSIYTPGRREAL